MMKLNSEGKKSINECTLGNYGTYGIVDIVSYESIVHENSRRRDAIFRCYEIKVSKSDFYSKSKWTFVGHYNYFIMPFDLLKEVKDDIPKGIGVITYRNGKFTSSIKASKKVPLVKEDRFFFDFISSMDREINKTVYGNRGIKEMETVDLVNELQIRVARENRTNSGSFRYYGLKTKILKLIKELKELYK